MGTYQRELRKGLIIRSHYEIDQSPEDTIILGWKQSATSERLLSICPKGWEFEKHALVRALWHYVGWTPGLASNICFTQTRILLATNMKKCGRIYKDLLNLSTRQSQMAKDLRAIRTITYAQKTLAECLSGLHYKLTSSREVLCHIGGH